MRPEPGGFILPEILVLAGLRFRRRAIIAGGAILYWGFCRDKTPSGPQFVRESDPRSTPTSSPRVIVGIGTLLGLGFILLVFFMQSVLFLRVYSKPKDLRV